MEFFYKEVTNDAAIRKHVVEAIVLHARMAKGQTMSVWFAQYESTMHALFY